MPRQGTRSGLREDKDRTGEPATPELPLDALEAEGDAAFPSLEGEPPPQAESAQLPPLRTAPKTQIGVLQLIILAMLGMAVGFALVMLI
jgi:hypothetical protein